MERIELSRGMDVDSLERRLQLRRRARMDGQADRPAADDADLCPAERDIGVAIATERSRLTVIERGIVADLERALSARPTPRQDGPAAASNADLSLRLEEGRLGPDLREARLRAERASADLKSFRQRHRLEQDAAYPESRILAFGLLAAAAVFEAVFSATLFVHDADGGYAEAAAVAMGLGGSNVLLGVLAGYIGLRYWRARHGALKAMGGAALLGFAGLAIGLNLFAARYRESLAQTTDGDRPLAHLARGEFLGLITPEAVVLLMIGVGVWIFSATKGYAGLDDPYPDYGKLDRQASRSTSAYAALRDEAIATMRDPIEAANAVIEADLNAHRDHVAALWRAFDAAGAPCQALGACHRALDTLHRALLDLYWTENAAARSTPLPPRAPPPPETHPDPLAQAGDAIKAADAALQAAMRQASEARTSLQTLHGESLARILGAAA